MHQNSSNSDEPHIQNAVFLSQGKCPLLKAIVIPQQIKLKNQKQTKQNKKKKTQQTNPPQNKTKKWGGECFLINTANKAFFFPLRLYFIHTSTAKAESPGQTCIKSMSTSFTRHGLSFKILMTTDKNFHQKLFPMTPMKHWKIQFLPRSANPVLTETLFLNISSPLGTTVLGKVTILFLIKDNLLHLINTTVQLMNKVIKNINTDSYSCVSKVTIWSKIWKYVSNHKLES